MHACIHGLIMWIQVYITWNADNKIPDLVIIISTHQKACDTLKNNNRTTIGYGTPHEINCIHCIIWISVFHSLQKHCTVPIRFSQFPDADFWILVSASYMMLISYLIYLQYSYHTYNLSWIKRLGDVSCKTMHSRYHFGFRRNVLFCILVKA